MSCATHWFVWGVVLLREKLPRLDRVDAVSHSHSSLDFFFHYSNWANGIRFLNSSTRFARHFPEGRRVFVKRNIDTRFLVTDGVAIASWSGSQRHSTLLPGFGSLVLEGDGDRFTGVNDGVRLLNCYVSSLSIHDHHNFALVFLWLVA